MCWVRTQAGHGGSMYHQVPHKVLHRARMPRKTGAPTSTRARRCAECVACGHTRAKANTTCRPLAAIMLHQARVQTRALCARLSASRGAPPN
eukprot:14306001-Alexandrium_andersonii.AAC.1